MTTITETHSWLENILASVRPALDTESSDWLAGVRLQAQQGLTELPIPNRKQEAWRYTSINALTSHAFESPATDLTQLTQGQIPDSLCNSESIRLVLVNGQYCEHLSSLSSVPEGVKIVSMRTALRENQDMLKQWFTHAKTTQKDIFTSLNSALINDGLFIHISKNCAVQQPIEVCYLTLESKNPILIQPRNLIVLESGANVSLVEQFCSTGPTVYFNNGITDIALSPNAQFKHCRLQQESRQAYHLQRLNIKLDRDSHYQHTALSLGAAWSRNDINVTFDAAGAECLIDGLYTVGKQQLNDFHLNINHQAPHCHSQSNFKGVLHGKGRGVFDGAIVVAQDAQKTDAHLSNKNLLLCDGAEIDTKPQLEIYADDVKCSHGTTVGQIDPQQVFYLRSRGIDEHQARKMISLGFAREVLESIELESVRDYADQQLSNMLSEVLTPQSETI